MTASKQRRCGYVYPEGHVAVGWTCSQFNGLHDHEAHERDPFPCDPTSCNYHEPVWEDDAQPEAPVATAVTISVECASAIWDALCGGPIPEPKYAMEFLAALGTARKEQ